MPPTGSMMLVVTVSRKSKIVRPHMVYSLHGPTESEHIGLSMSKGRVTVSTALTRDMPARFSINATETSASEMVDVNAATVSSRKNSDDHTRVPPIWANISGRVMNTRAEPARLLSCKPNVITAGKMMKPMNMATMRSSSETVTAVRVSFASDGK